MPQPTREDAILLLQSDVPAAAAITERRIELTRRVLAICDELGYTFASWDAPIYPELDDLGDVEILLAVEEMFGIGIDEASFAAAHPTTFGDLILFLETQTADVTITDMSASYVPGRCATQAYFYVVRRLVREVNAAASSLRMRPGTRLDDVLPSETADEFSKQVLRQFGASIRPERRVFGRLEFGATWLAVYALTFIFGGIALSDSRYAVPLLFFGLTLYPALIAYLLYKLSRPVWRGSLATLGSLTYVLANIPEKDDI